MPAPPTRQEGASISAPESTRPRRLSTTYDWRAGPAKFRTAKDRFQANVAAAFLKTRPDIGLLPVKAYRISLKNAMNDKKRLKLMTDAIEAEIRNIHDNKVAKPTHYKRIPAEYRTSIIPTHLFLKEKYTAEGSFDKIKARLVANGDQVDEDQLGETFSPTVNPVSVLTQLNIAASRRDEIAAYDIKGAFLLTPYELERRRFVRITKDLVPYWIEIYPEDKKYIHTDGCLYMELLKFMYGLPEAPHEFNNLFDRNLQAIGMQPSRADPCLYTMRVPEGTIIVSIHVDDMLLTCPNKKWREWFEQKMKKNFELVCQYDNLSYLGMSVKRDPNTGDIHVNQTGYIKELLKRYGLKQVAKPPKMPAATTLLDQEDKDSPKVSQKEFLSVIMSLLYLARFTRPDILFATIILATRSANPTEEDLKKALRIVKYLAGTIEVGLTFRAKIPLIPKIFADASHCIHQDGKGHGGITITLGSAPVHSRSFKLKMTTRSSSESELVVLEEASTYVTWYSTLLKSMGIEARKPLTIYQDNQSTIIMAMQGANFKRTKHLMCKESYVKEQITNGELTLRYLPTNDMPADMLTKPLSQLKLRRCMNQLHLH